MFEGAFPPMDLVVLWTLSLAGALDRTLAGASLYWPAAPRTGQVVRVLPARVREIASYCGVA